MKKYFSQKLRALRNAAKMSQEQLANQLGVTTQAVSKWECDLAYPDIELLMQIADIYGVTIDSLLRENAEAEDAAEGPTEPEAPAVCSAEEMPEAEEPMEEPEAEDDTAGCGTTKADEVEENVLKELNLPDDDVIRVIQFKGCRVITKDVLDDAIVVPIHIEEERGWLHRRNEIRVEVWGNVQIEGDLTGNLQAGGAVECTDVGGNVKSNGTVYCTDVAGNVNANGSLNCADIAGNVQAGGTVTCGDVSGNVSCGGHLECGDIEGDVQSCAGSINCGDIEGDVRSCNGGITCGDIDGSIQSCIGDIHCGDIEGDVHCEGHVIH